MNKTSQISQFVKLGQEPSLPENPVRSYRVVVDGMSLPNSVLEDIRGFSLCKSYSTKQIRRINRLRVRKVKSGHANQKTSILRQIRHVPANKQEHIKRACGRGDLA